MPAPDRTNLPYTKDSEQGVLNKSQDSKYDVLAVELLAENDAGTALNRLGADSLGNLKTGSAPVATRIDDVTTTNVTYIGRAVPGTATSSATWQIQKIDATSGTIITWASGNANFTNVWDNRVSLSYS